VLYLFLIWCLLAVVVLSMAGYRRMIANHEDDLVHLGDADARLITAQKGVATRLTVIDKWGKILTMVTVAFGLVIGCVYLYQGWIETSTRVQP
jgi:hypothetical protein